MFKKVLSVTQINEYIKSIFTIDPILSSVSVKGEISNFKHHYSGHMYFTLKDDNCKIKCVMFKSSCYNLKFKPEDGMNVILSGSISLYERDGQYQLYANDMQPDGKGALFVAFEQLKKKLEEEGLFDPKNKMPIPKYPSKIGVVTSSSGAAVRDIINVMARRYPGIEILIVPVLVQGSDAAIDIAKGIKLLNTRDDIDIIITGRGGGSVEELWAFNEECVARAIYNSEIPVISSVGHETDFTIADFVADLRAPTPSAAAELSVPDKIELIFKFNTYSNSMKSIINRKINEKRNLIKSNKHVLNTLNPLVEINQKRQFIDSLNTQMISQINHKLEIMKQLLKKHSANLQALSPLSIISRGYSIVYISDSNQVVDDIKRVKNNDNIDVLVKNGIIKCSVENVLEEEISGEKGK